MFDRLISFIAPHRCLGCGESGNLLCHTCLEEHLRPAPSRCYRCYKATKQFQTCPTCRASVGLQHVWVGTVYEGLPKELLYKFKFQRARAASKDIAEYLDALLPLLPGDTIICHIPTAHARIRRRGYDQARLIAKSLSLSRGFAHGPLLLRQTSTRQLGSARKLRFAQANQAFRANKVPKDAHVLLIDDVSTSGATLEAAAKILREAGAKTVDACVYAQAID